METCKIMSIKMNNFIKPSDKITRINGIQEVDNDYFSGANIITKQVSENSCLFLNKNIQEGLEIDCNRIINYNTKNPSDIFKIANSKDLEEYYEQFKKKLFSPEFTKENVQCIVSHSEYIKGIMNLHFKLNNLDAVLCVYKNQDGLIIEKEKYLILLEDLITKKSSDKIYYDLKNDADKIPIIKKDGLMSSKIRYGTKKIDKEDLQDGYKYEKNKLFTSCTKFKNCKYTTNELYENSCEDNKKKVYEIELITLNKKGGKKTKNKKIKKIKKFTKNIRKKKNKKTKKGRKKKYTKKNK